MSFDRPVRITLPEMPAELRECVKAEDKGIVAELPKYLTHSDNDTPLPHRQGTGFENA